MSELVVAGTWIALDYAMLCLDCEVSFDLRAFARCPKCGCESEVLLARFLQERPRAVAASDAGSPRTPGSRRVVE